jgi:hypothetical protein
MSKPMPDYGINFNSPTITMSFEEAQESGESIAHRFLTQQISDLNYNHELSAAQLWAVRKDGTFHLLSAHPDVYELLQDKYDLSNYLGVILHTTGWAAPLDENGKVDGAPSKHAQRRRVALASCVTNISVGSALSFDDEKEMIMDPGSATGSLAEALLSFWEQNFIVSTLSFD